MVPIVAHDTLATFASSCGGGTTAEGKSPQNTWFAGPERIGEYPVRLLPLQEEIGVREQRLNAGGPCRNTAGNYARGFAQGPLLSLISVAFGALGD